MIPIIKTIARYGKFAGKEKYQGVLQHVRLYSIYGFHIKKRVGNSYQHALYHLKIKSAYGYLCNTVSIDSTVNLFNQSLKYGTRTTFCKISSAVSNHILY